ncbi:MAG: efflux RND transporter periplasmic adaptor subunit [Gammaproteobacteria bacterium]|nr:efflux RND transporter periplasmic adaptor subunit [Gammaproteobacteria bacterium]
MITSIWISTKGCRTLGFAALVVACLNSTVVLAQNLSELDCVIEPHVVIDLSSRVDGIVEKMEVERGELIEKGQILVRLESSVERAAVAEAKVRAEATAEIDASNISADFAQRRNERIRKLHRSQAVSTDQLDEIETQYELSRLQQKRAEENQLIAKLELRQAREVLNLHTLRSPIRGIVVQHYLAPGEAVEEQPIMRLAQIDPLRVEVIVPVSAFGTIKVGQRAIMRPESPMEGEYSATVTIVDGVADASSGTFRVRLGLANEDYSLPSGLRCRVRFLPDEPPATTTPAAIVAEADEESSHDLVPIKSDPTSYEMVKTARALTEATTEGVAERCQTIGPISDPAQADRIMSTLAGQATQLRLREEGQNSVKSYLILALAQPSPEDSRALTDRMAAAGFNDFHVIWRGPHKDRIALGFHRKRTYAEQRKARLAKLGFESELILQTENRSRYWLDVELLPQITSLDLAAAEQTLGKLDLSALSCEIATNPDQPVQTLAEASTPR